MWQTCSPRLCVVNNDELSHAIPFDLCQLSEMRSNRFACRFFRDTIDENYRVKNVQGFFFESLLFSKWQLFS